jgi:mono/diheme cytochrome c family protein
LKKQGEPFFPDVIFKDAVVMVIVFLVVLALAAFVGVPMEQVADPTTTTYVPRPEWYFLFLFEMLKFFPGRLEFVGALIVPAAFFILLFVLPYIDRNPSRRYRSRPVALGAATVVAAAIVFLGVRGALSQPPQVTAAAGPSEAELRLTPFERQGLQVYEANKCYVCHRINGSGGAIGPDLSTVGLRLDASWIVHHLETPGATAPGTTMPQFTLSNQDIFALAAYLLSLRVSQAPSGPVVATLSSSAQAGQAIFSASCNACHPNGEAGIGPQLYGADFNKTFGNDTTLAQFIRTGKGNMPAFTPGQITDAQMTDLIAYLRSLAAPTQ